MDKKLTILFLCGWYPSRVLPNNGDFIQRHAKAVSLIHNVEVIHIVSDDNCNAKIEIETTKTDGINTYIGYVKATTNPILKLIRFWKTYLILLKKINNFEIVHLNEIFPFGLFALYLKWFQKKPFIVSEHWTGYHNPQSKKLPTIQKIISRIIVKHASFICPVSNNLKKSLESLNYKGNYKRVPNVVDTGLFFPKENTNAIFTITHISNMDNAHKNIEGILRVIAKLRPIIGDFRFKLIGENAKKYSAYSKKLNIAADTIFFADHLPHKKIADELTKSDVFVLFSNYENLPCVILEAFSCGVPVISTNVGGISEFFPKEFGYLIPPKNELELEQKIVEIYTNFKDNKIAMHQYAKANFSEHKIAADFSNLYNTLKT